MATLQFPKTGGGTCGIEVAGNEADFTKPVIGVEDGTPLLVEGEPPVTTSGGVELAGVAQMYYKGCSGSPADPAIIGHDCSPSGSPQVSKGFLFISPGSTTNGTSEMMSSTSGHIWDTLPPGTYTLHLNASERNFTAPMNVDVHLLADNNPASLYDAVIDETIEEYTGLTFPTAPSSGYSDDIVFTIPDGPNRNVAIEFWGPESQQFTYITNVRFNIVVTKS